MAPSLGMLFYLEHDFTMKSIWLNRSAPILNWQCFRLVAHRQQGRNGAYWLNSAWQGSRNKRFSLFSTCFLLIVPSWRYLTGTRKKGYFRPGFHFSGLDSILTAGAQSTRESPWIHYHVTTAARATSGITRMPPIRGIWRLRKFLESGNFVVYRWIHRSVCRPVPS